MSESDYKKNQDRVEPKNGGADSGDTFESFQAQLDEARFISSFMTSVCTSLELDGICSIAARALYEYSPYCQVIFAFSASLDGKVIAFSPMIQKNTMAAKPIVSVGKSVSLSSPHDSSLSSIHLNLNDGLGTIAIYHAAGQCKTFSDPLLANVVDCFSQATKNALQHGKIKDLAMRDGLTDLFNRRTFDETLAQKGKLSKKLPISVLILDLDNFKRINDTYGHQSGDQVLKSFAKILKESCRGHDLVARFGGEEFAIILSQTKAATAHAIAQRIRNALAKTTFSFEGKKTHITASIGLATCQDAITSNLVKQADQALYQAKMTGKNKVCTFPVNLLTDSTHSYRSKGFGPLFSVSY